ncbi:MAG: methyl-accepting chemotaxis protein [Acidobacteria bacterium]|nr:methyl-accepting chemotaxis protein [Acidobacteriota bacterium]
MNADTLALPEPAAAAPDRGVGALIEICERAAAGDLEARVVGLGDDDLGRLGHAINHMLDTADSFVREAAAAMECCSHDQFHRPILLRGLKGAYRQSAAVINAAGVKMRDGRAEISFVGRLAEGNLASVQSVAGSCAHLSDTNHQIAREAADSARATQQAVAEATRAGEAVAAMNAAVQKIDSIVTLINRVAEQTNLLALNATIEAARAGEAGKGFAVVASEVKELSRDTARATREISQQVEKIQGAARGVATLITGINESVQRIDASAVVIANSVAEQVQATAEINRSINEVSANATQVSERIAATRSQAGQPTAARR